MKNLRHEKILELIQNNIIETQEALQNLLLGYGFEVTQATVSRDIRELKLIKVLTADGGYRYSVSNIENEEKTHFTQLIKTAVISIDCAINTVVIKSRIGMAQAVCTALDAMNYSQIVGTIAGDDTIFILLRAEKDALEFVNTLNILILN